MSARKLGKGITLEMYIRNTQVNNKKKKEAVVLQSLLYAHIHYSDPLYFLSSRLYQTKSCNVKLPAESESEES